MSNIESNRRTDLGNTHNQISKQPPQRISHFLTFNNYTTEDLSKLLLLCNDRKIVRQFSMQEETGENGTPHIQGCIVLHKAMRTTQFNLSSKIHWEKPKDVKASLQYCNKLETRTGGFWNFGLPKEIKYLMKDKFYDWQRDILLILQNEPDDRHINWVFEKKGNVGKSAFVKNMVIENSALFCNGGKCSDLINLIFNNNMDECNILFWDLPRENKGKVSYSTIEAVKNGMVCNTKYETGTKIFNPPHIVIFCNYPPENTNDLSKDRWRIFEIVDLKLTTFVENDIDTDFET